MPHFGPKLSLPVVACTALTTLFVLGSAVMAGAGPAAPYTEEAAIAIIRAMESLMPKDGPGEVPFLEQVRFMVDWFRAGYRAAGYDSDATLRQVCDDLLHQRLSDGPIFMGYLMPVDKMMMECETANADCLSLFPQDLAELIKRVMALGSAANPPSAEEAKSEIPPRWQAFRQVLAAGDIEEALTYFIPSERDRYRKAFEALRQHLPAMAAEIATIGFVTLEENRAKYRLRRKQMVRGEIYEVSHFIWFQKIAGAWFIESF